MKHKQDFAQHFENHLREVTATALEGVPPNLAEAIRYSLLAPGKRIRPRLVLAAARMVGLDEKPALAVACAIEMIHCFTLIHDDLPCMDNDDFRRGLPSSHKKFGEAVALLAGDALMGTAVTVFSEAAETLRPPHFTRGLLRLCQAMGPQGVIGGQAAEMLMNERSTLEDLRRMHAGKTGALFLASILIPADFAGIPAEGPQFAAIDRFARQLGLAFQVADDLADAEQDKGKPLSVLYFMPPEKARAQTLKDLEESCTALLNVWETEAEDLIGIARQVAASLQK